MHDEESLCIRHSVYWHCHVGASPKPSADSPNRLSAVVTKSKRKDKILIDYLQFGDVEWLGAEAVGHEVLNLLPDRISTLSREELAKLEDAFGPDGGFPVIAPDTEIG